MTGKMLKSWLMTNSSNSEVKLKKKTKQNVKIRQNQNTDNDSAECSNITAWQTQNVQNAHAA